MNSTTWQKANSPQPNPATKAAGKKPGMVGKVLGNALNWEMGKSIAPLKDFGVVLVRMLAVVFIQAGLLPRDYAGAYGGPRPHFTRVIGDAYANIVWQKQNTLQIAFFFSVVGFLASTVVVALLALMGAVMGQAHAQSMFVYEGGGGPGPALSNSQDLGSNIVDFMLGINTDDLGGNFAINADRIVGAINEMLGYYSRAMLVFAAVILLYLLVSMVAETAHEGVTLGKRANQIWAPIRLVMAIGLLVPLGTGMSGLNTGQFIVAQVAKWGSGLASNVWQEFTRNIGGGLGSPEPILGRMEVPTFTSLDLSGSLYNMTQIYMCMEAWNDTIGANRTPPPDPKDLVTQDPAGIDNNTTSIRFRNDRHSTAPGQPSPRMECGEIRIDVPNMPGVSPTGAQAQTVEITNQMSGITRSIAAQLRILTSTANAADKVAAKTEIARLLEIYNQTSIQFRETTLGRMGLGGGGLGGEIGRDLGRRLINSATGGFIAGNAYIDGQDLGWLAAGAWFMNLTMDYTGQYFGSFVQPPYITAPSAFATTRAPSNIQNAYQMRYNAMFDAFENILRDARRTSTEFNNVPYPLDNNLVNQMLQRMESAAQGMSGRTVINSILIFIDTALAFKGVWTPGSVVEFNMAPGLTSSGATTNLGVTIDSRSNPLAGFIAFGNRWIAGCLELIGTGVGLQAAGAAANLSGDAVRAMTQNLRGIVGMLANSVPASLKAAGVMGSIGGFLTFLGTVGLVAGLMIAFMVPLQPFLKFFFNVMSWLMGVFEAVLAVPLIAIAHLNPEGNGLPGQNARGAYFLILNIFLRPVLMVFGLCFGLIMFILGVGLVNTFFEVATASSFISAENTQFVAMAILTKIIMTIIYLSVIYVLSTSAFKGIDYFPTQALRWIGQSPGSLEKMGDPSTVGQGISQSGTFFGTQLTGQISGGISSAQQSTQAAIAAGTFR